MAKKIERVRNSCDLVQSLKIKGKITYIQRYYGWLPMRNIKMFKKKKAETLYQSLLLIIYRVKASQFINNVM